jgi:mRNA-degrading endonuclease RelE of RelBE toxin-antitoxin system
MTTLTKWQVKGKKTGAELRKLHLNVSEVADELKATMQAGIKDTVGLKAIEGFLKQNEKFKMPSNKDNDDEYVDKQKEALADLFSDFSKIADSAAERREAAEKASKKAESTKVKFTWTVLQGGSFKKDIGDIKDGSELSKLKEWLKDLPSEGPHDAAGNAHLRNEKMSGNEWHVYLGSAFRVYYDIDDKNHTVTLKRAGHDKEKK